MVTRNREREYEKYRERRARVAEARANIWLKQTHNYTDLIMKFKCPLCEEQLRMHIGAVVDTGYGINTGHHTNTHCPVCLTIISHDGKLLVRNGRILLPVVQNR